MITQLACVLFQIMGKKEKTNGKKYGQYKPDIRHKVPDLLAAQCLIPYLIISLATQYD